MPKFSELTLPQQRMLLDGWATSSSPVMRLTTRDGVSYDVRLQGRANLLSSQGVSTDAKSNKTGHVVAQEYGSGMLAVFAMRDIAELEPAPLQITDPNHPDFEPEEQVVKPLAWERKVAGDNRHAQR